MTLPRSSIVDYESPSFYHCISRCVRREALIKDPVRRRWILDRLEFLSRHLAIEIFAYAIMENHLHILIRIRPDLVRQLDDREVAVRRLGVLPRGSRRKLAGDENRSAPDEMSVRAMLGSPAAMRKARRDLSDPGFFHRLLKEPCARIWNKEDGVTGHFWEGRYKSPRVLDDESLLRVARYIDLNQIRARESRSIPTSAWTTARHHWNRLRTVIRKCCIDSDDSVTACARAVCEVAWVPAFPSEDPPRPSATRSDSTPHASRPKGHVPLVGYLLALDRVGRQRRSDAQGAIPAESPSSLQDALAHVLTKAARRGRESYSWMSRWTSSIMAAVADSTCSLQQSLSHAGAIDSARGSCYGGQEQVAAEARRRGLKRVVALPSP